MQIFSRWKQEWNAAWEHIQEQIYNLSSEGKKTWHGLGYLFEQARATNGLRFNFGNARLIEDNQAIAPQPRLVMSETVFRELLYYMRRFRGEGQVMGFIDVHKDNAFIVSELVIPPHTAGPASADLDQDKFPFWLESLVESGKDVTKLRMQGHSHGDIASYFSAEDIDTIREEYACDWMVSVVGNRLGIFHARLDIYRPIPISISLPMFVENLTTYAEPNEILAWSSKLEDTQTGELIETVELSHKGRNNGKF